jgi:hypothetical protein
MRTSIVGFFLLASTIGHAEKNDPSPGFIDMDELSSAAYVDCVTPRIAGQLSLISDIKAFNTAAAKALNGIARQFGVAVPSAVR